MHILFVCTGNTCRSPMAQALFCAEAGARGLAGRYTADSCGLAATVGEAASANAVTAAAERGGDLSCHRAKPATEELLRAADRIVCMSPAHRAALLSALPQLADRMTVLDPPIPDPFGGNLSDYRATAEVLQGAVRTLLDTLISAEN